MTQGCRSLEAPVLSPAAMFWEGHAIHWKLQHICADLPLAITRAMHPAHLSLLWRSALTSLHSKELLRELCESLPAVPLVLTCHSFQKLLHYCWERVVQVF